MQYSGTDVTITAALALTSTPIGTRPANKRTGSASFTPRSSAKDTAAAASAAHHEASRCPRMKNT
jgi:hypothetical protein